MEEKTTTNVKQPEDTFSSDTPQQGNEPVFTFSGKKIIFTIIFLIIGILINLGAFIKIDRSNTITIIPLTPTFAPTITTAVSSCPFNYKIYSVAQALADPQNTCGLRINVPEDLPGLSSVSASLTNLYKLSIIDLDEAEIPKKIGNLTSLQELEINTIEGQVVIPPEIANLTQLKKLYISHTPELTYLPVSVSKLTRLQNITLRYSPQIKILDSLLSHPSLEIINLTGQDLDTIPNMIYHLPDLKSLFLTDNHIATVSADIANLTSLQRLNLDFNKITNFPTIDTLENLDTLELRQNKLTKLPKGIEKLKKLKNLRLPDNAIDDTTSGKLQQLTDLEVLDLGNNQLTKLPEGIENLKKLQYLRLTGNKIDPKSIDELKKKLPKTIIAM